MHSKRMNKLSTEERKQVVGALVEGNSLRSITRMTGVHRTTVMKLLCDLGRACSEYQDKIFRNLSCKRVQCDEIWAFVGAKEKHATPEQRAEGWGDIWTWTAIDADSKLLVSFLVGNRGPHTEPRPETRTQPRPELVEGRAADSTHAQAA